MKKIIIAIGVIVIAFLAFWLVEYKQKAYVNAQSDAKTIQSFNLIDTNGDALLDQQEFEVFAQKTIVDKKIDTPEKLIKFIEFKDFTWNNGDVNKDNFLTQDEFMAQAYRNREKFGKNKK